MPQYTIKDPTSGRTVTLTGDSPPTAAELEQIFAKVNGSPGSSAPAPEADDSVWGSVKRFGSALGSTLDPRPLVSIASDIGKTMDLGDPDAAAAARGRLGAIGSQLVRSQVDQGKKAIADFQAGNYSEAAGHAGAAALPVLGPAAAHAGERIGSGDIAGGLGEAAGLLLPSAAKYGGEVALTKSLVPTAQAVEDAKTALAAAKAAKGATAASALDALTPEQRATVQWAQDNGIPVDAATATGNKFVRGVQHVADRTLGGSIIGTKAEAAQARGLATVAEQLQAKASPFAVSPEQAGADVTDAIRGKVQGAAADADAAYDQFRQIAAQHAVEVPDIPAPGTPDAAPGKLTAGYRFAPQGAGLDRVFDAALGDARANGFQGAASKLRDVFDQHVQSAQNLAADTQGAIDEAGPAALMRDIRSLGGIRPFDMDYSGGVGTAARKLKEEYASLQQAFASRQGWAQNGGASIFRNGGLGMDDLVDQLRQDPKWQSIIQSPEDLKSALEDIAAQGPEKSGIPPTDLEHYLKASGVQKGSDWWKPAESTQTIEAPVDLGDAKAGLKPLYDELAQQAKLTPASMMGDKARAFQALDKIVNGPDTASAVTVDQALSDLKAFTRTGDSAVRSAGQGAVMRAQSLLEQSLGKTVSAMGPDAENALQAGRTATRAKYALDDLAQSISDEPVQAFKQGTRAGDTSIAKLRDLAAAAPDQMPAMGRAWLDSLFSKATENGRFDGRAGMAKAWENLGPQTKAVLFQDPGLRSDLDQFFKFARMSSENANPSGTAHAVATISHLHSIIAGPVVGLGEQGAWTAIGALLHSRAGVQLLTKGIRIPAGNAAALSGWGAQASALLNASTPSESLQPAGLGR